MDRLERILARVRAGGRVQISYDWFGSPNVRVGSPWLPLILAPRIRVTPKELAEIKDAVKQRTRS